MLSVLLNARRRGKASILKRFILVPSEKVSKLEDHNAAVASDEISLAVQTFGTCAVLNRVALSFVG